MANEKRVVLKKGGPTPDVEVIVGEAQWGSYTIRLGAADGKSWDREWPGRSWDSIQDRFSLEKSASELDKRDLGIDLVLTPVKVGDPYAAEVRITQGGHNVPGGSQIYKGTTSGHNEHILDMVRLVAE
jgi:hypothetical protein